MKNLIKIIMLLFFSVYAFSQVNIWVNVKGGNAMFYNPKTMIWEPIVSKQQIPAKTFVLTSDKSQFKAYKETDVSEGPPGGYFFLDDIFPRNKMQIVEELTIIEAQQLRSVPGEDSLKQKGAFGLTYGLPATPSKSESNIPYLKDREKAIFWFYEQKRYDAAVLSLKRLIVQFPTLYYKEKLTELLFKLYNSLELYGFLYSETNWLMVVQKEGELSSQIRKWNDFARQKLTNK